jgi:excisionase family DNA binding protein
MMGAMDRTNAPAPLAVSVAEAARITGLSRALIYRALGDGTGPRTFTFGRRRLVRIADLDAWLAELAESSAARGAA